MCGHYTLFTPPEELGTRFDAMPTRPLLVRYNRAPGQKLSIAINDASEEFRFLKWEFVPSWVDNASVGNNRVNVCAEIVREKRSFADAHKARQCLVPSNGFYEWVDRSGRKQSYRAAFEDDRPFAMAGLWERWAAPTKQTGLGDFGSGGSSREQESLETFIVVTTGLNDLVPEPHHRMVVVPVSGDGQTWLHGGPGEAAALLDTYPDDELTTYPVSARVNSPANDSPDPIERVEA